MVSKTRIKWVKRRHCFLLLEALIFYNHIKSPSFSSAFLQSMHVSAFSNAKYALMCKLILIFNAKNYLTFIKVPKTLMSTNF